MKRANLILGMPASGKSTYIAAMGHMLLSEEVPTKLRLTGLNEDDEAHIAALQERWLRYEELKHTPTGGENWITFHLEASNGSKEFTVELPDFSGESLKSAAVTGIYPTELHEALQKSTGIFLFTSAAAKHDDVLLNELHGFESVSAESDSEPEGEHSLTPQSNTGQDDEKQFDPLEMPEQVKVVQLLQAIVGFEQRKRKLVIMVSAWDIVSSVDVAIEPVEWLMNNRPMLWQYLHFNDESWNFRIYGVSAQGGRLPDDKVALQKILKPSQRVKLIGHSAALHDLTEPLDWVSSIQV